MAAAYKKVEPERPQLETTDRAPSHSQSHTRIFVGADTLRGEARQREIDEAAQRAAERAGNAARQRRVKKLFMKLDTDKDGHLNMEQVTQLLKELAGGKTPSEDELAFMKRMAGWEPPLDHFALASLHDAINYWQQYVEAFETPSSWGSVVFSKHDPQGKGTLGVKELQAFLTELNGGDPVSEAEASWVLRQADVLGSGDITRIEMMQAASIWFSRTVRVKLIRKQHTQQLEQSGKGIMSRFCVIQ